MTLSHKDGQLFYNLWLPLLDFVNEKCAVNKKLTNLAGAESLNTKEVKEIANTLWDNVELIDQYLAEYGGDMPGDYKQIMKSWKGRVQGRFVMERHLKKGTIFISLEDEKVYQVCGIISSWKEMFRSAPMPLAVEATFIPFRDVIISDGLVMPYNIAIGKNMAKQFKETYMDAKKNNTLIKSLQQRDFIKPENKGNIQRQKWNRFNKLTEKCYNNMMGAEKDGKCWSQTFELLKEIVQEERKEYPGFASQLEMIDDVTDYKYDIQGWLEDCLDEIDMREEYEVLLGMCDDLLNMFTWPEYTGSDIKFRKSEVLGALGRKDEAVKYCKAWIKEEPENIVAATAGVYAFIDVKEFDAAEELVDRFIHDKSACSDENDIMFAAASKLYKIMGKKKEKEQIDKAFRDYEDYLEQYFEDLNYDEDELDFFDDDLPFN